MINAMAMFAPVPPPTFDDFVRFISLQERYPFQVVIALFKEPQQADHKVKLR